MDRKTLIAAIKSKKTFLCVGLDTDAEKLPLHLRDKENGVVEFNRSIIEATKEFCVSYKVNTAFYESRGSKGWQELEETAALIPKTHLSIADAKRGDIGNTSAQYAKSFFETMDFDAITVAPYMGEDSLQPFFDYANKWTIVLGLTSNRGAKDYEMLKLASDDDEHLRAEYLYEHVLRTVAARSTSDNCMFVIGATQASEFTNIRSIVPDHFLLVPGVGFQGGSLREVSRHGMNKDCGLLVNVSRAIIHAGNGEDFAEEAARVASEYATEMKGYL